MSGVRSVILFGRVEYVFGQMATVFGTKTVVDSVFQTKFFNDFGGGGVRVVEM